MTRGRTYTLTLVAAAIYLLLTWAFADGLFYQKWWNSSDITNSAVFTYMFLALILAAGFYQAQQVSNFELRNPASNPVEDDGQTDDPRFWKLIMGNVYWSLLWLPIRFYVGREWLAAGEEKLRSGAWVGGGTALKGFWTRAITIPQAGQPPITYGWYRDVLRYMLDHRWYTWFGPLIAVGETLVGIGLIVGALVGIAAFFGTLMNFTYQLAGSASSNPVLFALSVFLILAWKVAGNWGFDHWLLPSLGAPWKAGSLFRGGGIRPMEPERREPA